MWSSRQTVKKQALDGLRTVASGVVEALGAGPAHRRRLDEIDTRIVVSGVRGKSSVANWLHEQFVSRGYDTYTKITGSDAQVRYNDTVSGSSANSRSDCTKTSVSWLSSTVSTSQSSRIKESDPTRHGWSTSSSSTPIWCFSPMSGRTTSTR